MTKPQHSYIELLASWLNSSTESESNERFLAYYAFLVGDFFSDNPRKQGPLLRFIEFKLRFDARTNEDPAALAQDLTMQFVDKHLRNLKDDRIKAIERIAARYPELSLSSLGPFFSRQNDSWKSRFKAWAVTASGFGAVPYENTQACDAAAMAINTQWPPLRAEGDGLLHWVLTCRNGTDANSTNVSEPTADASTGETDFESIGTEDYFPKIDDVLIDASDDDKVTDSKSESGASRRELDRRVRRLIAIMEEDGITAADATAGCAGGAAYSIALNDVLKLSSKVRVPVQAFVIYVQARHFVDDFLRSPVRNDPAVSLTVADESDSSEADESHEIPIQYNDHTADAWITLNDVELLLRAPVRKAEAQLESTRTLRQRETAEERLAKAKASFELRWAAFDLFTDGHTELEVGLRLGFGPDPIRARQKASDIKKAIAKILAPLKP